MRFKKEFVLSDVDDYVIAVPVNNSADEFKGIIRLNKTAAFIWRSIDRGLDIEQIANEMLKRFSDVGYDTAVSSIKNTIDSFKKDGILDE